MIDVSDFVKRAAQRTGFRREFYQEKNLPTQPSNLLAVPFFGDIRSTFILTSLILKSYKQANPDKYVILCSWPGMRDLFPYVDEFWSLEDESVVKSLALEANNFYNTSNLAAEITRGLAEVLNVMTASDLKLYFDNGFTRHYWDNFKQIKRFLPEVPSVSRATAEFKTQMERATGRKVVVFPTTKMRSRQHGRTIYLPILKEFWTSLLNCLIDSGYTPVVYQNWFTYDVSRDMAEKCIYLVARNVTDVLAAFRHVGCVLDIHSGISRLAIAARCPYIAVTERQSYVEDKDYEIDDLCCDGLPRQYIFSFSTMLMTGGLEEWKVSVLDNLIVTLKEFLPKIQDIDLPSTNESYEMVSYEKVRQRKARRLGAAFINPSKKK